jgi:hypothetical protein
MALYLCPTHGTSPVQFVCAHLGEDFAAERPLRSSRLIRVLLRDIEPPNDIWFGTLLCDACIRSLAIPDGTDTLYDEEVEARYQQLYQPHVLCIHCFRHRTNPNATGNA